MVAGCFFLLVWDINLFPSINFQFTLIINSVTQAALSSYDAVAVLLAVVRGSKGELHRSSRNQLSEYLPLLMSVAQTP